MARNDQLVKIVLGQMFDFLKDKDPMLSGEDKDSGSELILALGTIGVDEEAKFTIIRGSTLGFGYDFQGSINGESARKIYERAVEDTKKVKGHPNFDNFIDSGVVDNRYGWYITII